MKIDHDNISADEIAALLQDNSSKEDRSYGDIAEHSNETKIEEPSNEHAAIPSEDRDDYSMPEEGWRKLEGFNNPAEFMAFFDNHINSGKVTLYPWQTEVGESIGEAKATAKHPYKLVLCTCNGSGKDKFIITPTVLWFICCKVRSLVVITSAGGVQLTNQTENDIQILAEKINQWSSHPDMYGRPIIKIRQRKLYCTLTGSMIVLFATDEPAKAEGYHPLEPDAEMMIVINEAKSVKPEIFSALRRCTGYNYWLLVSSPGEPVGAFHEAFEHWPNRRLVTYYDCPHHSAEEFEYDKQHLGEHDWLFRSKWLGLFTFIGGKSVVSPIALERLRKRIRQGSINHIFRDQAIRIGLDIALSKYGDESVITAFKGNKQIYRKEFRIQDATLLADVLARCMLEDLKITKEHSYIFGDDGGVGRAVIDILRRKGFVNIRRVLNQSAAKGKREFRNRGAEIWYKLSKLIEHGCLILLDDNTTFKQIASRKYKESTAGLDKLTLQSKPEMIGEGLPSPDRADAIALALCDTKVDDWITKNATVEGDAVVVISEEDQMRELYRDIRRGERVEESKGHCFYSQNSLIRERSNNYGR